MTPLTEALRRTAAKLTPHRDALVECCTRSLAATVANPEVPLRSFCARTVDELLHRLSEGEVEALLEAEARDAEEAARRGTSFHMEALSIRILDRCCLPFLLQSCATTSELAECLLALDELGDRRLEILLTAQEDEAHRRLQEADERVAQAADKARDLARINEALRKSEEQSHHRAEQIGLLSSVAHRLAGILEPERLMQEAAETIQVRTNHTFVAVVVLDDEGVLVGRWAGRKGVGRQSRGRTQGPAGGIIGRALRRKAPQVVGDVSQDRDYHADVPGTVSEMVIPLLEEGEVLGALDFQSDAHTAFGLDDVAVGETLAEFLVIALRNARLLAEARRARG